MQTAIIHGGIMGAACSSLSRRAWFNLGGILLGLAAIGSVVAGCSSGQTQKGQAAPTPVASVVRGETLFQQNCRSCHGKEGDRLPVAPLNSAPFLSSRGDSTLMAVIMEGKGVMPAFGKNRDGPFEGRDAQMVLAYINTLAGRASASILAEVGKEVYTANCVRCHGSNGDRIPIAPLNAKGFLDSRTDSALLETISGGKGPMPPMAQSKGGAISDEQVKAAIAFLRSRVDTSMAQAVGKGRDLYMTNCLGCHGETGDRVPTVKLASGEYLQKQGDGRIILTIYEGSGIMPGFGREKGGGFAVADVAALVSYLKSWAGLSATTALTGPEGAGVGRDLFVQNCSPCHGQGGDRVAGVQLKSAEFLNARTEKVILQTIGEGNAKGMPAWSKSSGGPLDDRQIASILDYLKSAAGGVSAARSGQSGSGPKTEPSTTVTPEMIAKGNDLFQSGPCVGCHRPTRDGVPNARLNDAAWLQERGDTELSRAIAEGRGAMPSWGKAKGGYLDAQDIKAIIAYLKDAAGAAPTSSPPRVPAPVPTLAPSPTPANTASKGEVPAAPPSAELIGKGKDLFQKGACIGCHRPTRDGIPTAKLADLTWLQGRGDAELAKSIAEGKGGMPAWGKAKGGQLDESDMKAVIAYLKDAAGGGAGAPARPEAGPAVSPELVAKGQDLFQKGACIGCHRPTRDGIPTAKLADLTWLQGRGDAELAKSIAEGKGGMPAWGKAKGGQLDESDIKAVIAYLKDAAGGAKGKVGTPTPPVKPVVSAETGKRIFTTICANCHGLDGLRITQCPIGSKEWQSNTSLEGLMVRVVRGKMSSGMPAWGERAGGPLSDEEILSVAQYLGSIGK